MAVAVEFISGAERANRQPRMPRKPFGKITAPVFSIVSEDPSAPTQTIFEAISDKTDLTLQQVERAVDALKANGHLELTPEQSTERRKRAHPAYSPIRNEVVELRKAGKTVAEIVDALKLNGVELTRTKVENHIQRARQLKELVRPSPAEYLKARKKGQSYRTKNHAQVGLDVEVAFWQERQVDLLVNAGNVVRAYGEPSVAEFLEQAGLSLPTERRNKIFVETYYGAAISNAVYVSKEGQARSVLVSAGEMIALYQREDPNVFRRCVRFTNVINERMEERKVARVEQIAKTQFRSMFAVAYRHMGNSEDAFDVVQSAVIHLLESDVKFIGFENKDAMDRALACNVVEKQARNIIRSRKTQKRMPERGVVYLDETNDELFPDRTFVSPEDYVTSGNISVDQIANEVGIEKAEVERILRRWFARQKDGKQFRRRKPKAVVKKAIEEVPPPPIAPRKAIIFSANMRGELIRPIDEYLAKPIVGGEVDTVFEEQKRKAARERLSEIQKKEALEEKERHREWLWGQKPSKKSSISEDQSIAL